MGLLRFLSVLAAFWGVTGAIFLSISVVMMTPKMMVGLTISEARWAYSPEQIKSMAKQKADATVGIIYVLAAFVIQMVSLIATSWERIVVPCHWCWFGGIAIIILLISFCCRHWIHGGALEGMSKVVIKGHLDRRFGKKVQKPDWTTLTDMALNLRGIKKLNNETPPQFFKKMADFAEWEIPQECDLSEIEHE